MAEKEYVPFIEVTPGELITDELWHKMQIAVREGIDQRVLQAIEEIEKVVLAESALDTEKFEGKTLNDLKEEILEETIQHIPENTGYQRLYKILKVGEQTVIEHNLHQCPLVDVYQLDYFAVACAEDADKFKSFVTFYLYHSSEKKLKFKPADEVDFVTVEIEPKDGHAFKIPFSDMLDRLDVSYTPSSSLGDLETEFWKKFFAEPNDQFDDDQYCHSPWFERCCREEKPVKNLKKSGDWDDLWFQMRPRRTINYPVKFLAPEPDMISLNTPAPTQIQVDHFDFDTLGLTLLQAPPFGVPPVPPEAAPEPEAPPPEAPEPLSELKVMLLLKV
ncbi:MAG: hypothetical protein ACYTG0_07130 [Planctomycetota bacterium]|jgi:hypothetical protein